MLLCLFWSGIQFAPPIGLGAWLGPRFGPATALAAIALGALLLAGASLLRRAPGVSDDSPVRIVPKCGCEWHTNGNDRQELRTPESTPALAQKANGGSRQAA